MGCCGMAEIFTPVSLCDPERPGRLNRGAIGWSRTPLQDCSITGRWPRKKRWNYWAVTNETHLFSMTVSNVDYLGPVFLYVADFEAGTVVEESVPNLLGRGCKLPDLVNDDVVFDRKKLSLSMLHSAADTELHVVRLRADWPTFGGVGLTADLEVTYPDDHDTLNVVIPWSSKHFQFTAKHNTLPVNGSVVLGDTTIEFGSEQSFATLDYGRGVWPANSTWNWGSASGLRDGRRIGIQVGGTWTDGTGQTENAVMIDGTMRKNDEDLVWDYNPSDWMKPWRISTPTSSDIDLVFTPQLERIAITNAVLLKSEVHQLFGTYAGTVRDASGGSVHFDNLIGWAEEHKARW